MSPGRTSCLPDRPLIHDLVDVIVDDLAVLFGVRPEALDATLQPLLDAPFGGDGVERLGAVPRSPFLAGLVLVAFSAGGNTVAGLVFAARGLGAYVVYSEAIVIDRRLATVGAAVVPGIFDGLTPLAAGFATS